MRKDDDAKNAQLQLEVAVRKMDPGFIVEALKMAWDDSMSWQDELTSVDIARIFDGMEHFTENAEVVRWSICALQAIVAEEVKDQTSRQYSVQSIIRVGPFRVYNNDLGERILHKRLVAETEDFEKAAAKALARACPPEFNITVEKSAELVGFGRIRPDKLAKEKGIWLVPFEIQMGLDKDKAYDLRDKVHEMLSDRAKLEKLSEDKDLVEALEPEESDMERIQKAMKKKKARGGDKEEEEDLKFSHVPVTAVTMKQDVRGEKKDVVDSRITVVDDPCTFKVAKRIDVVLVAMCSHKENVDVQHCAAHLLRWVMAWGDADVAKAMTEAKAEDELEHAMAAHPDHRSLQTHCNFAKKALVELRKKAGISSP